MGIEITTKMKSGIDQIVSKFHDLVPGLEIMWYYNPNSNMVSFSMNYHGEYKVLNVTSWLLSIGDYDYYISEEIRKGLKNLFGIEEVDLT